MSENIDDVTGCVHGLVWGCRDCMIDLLTRERDEAVGMQAEERDWAAKWKARATAAEAKVAYLEPHLDHVCRLHARAEARVRELEERIIALEAQLTTRGACECGYDEVCALARRAQEAEARAAALTRVVEIAEIALRHGALPDGETNVVEWARRKLADALIAGGDPRPSLAAPAPAAAATPTTPAPEQAGEGERCPHACIDEHEQPTDESCPFSKPCPVHDAKEVRRG